jgi:uncharacterized protein
MKVQPSGTLRFSATDLAGYLACHHLTHLRVAKAHGLVETPAWNNPVAAAIAERGEEHERRYLERLRSEGVEVVDLAEVAHTPAGAQRTREAMAGGAEAIAQAALEDDRWLGIADVLRRVDRPSDLGDWSYEVEDTKLARKTAGGTILQLCLYSERVEALQGVRPERFYVVPPGQDFRREEYRIDDYAAYYRHVKARFLEFAHGAAPDRLDELTYPEPVPLCQVCVWWRRCDKRWRDDDHLSLVANISKLQIGELESREIRKLAELARMALPIPWKPARGSVESYERSREQARLQLESRLDNETRYELRPPQDGHGLARLPEPSPLDVFFDIEGDSFAEGGGREYLFGYAHRAAGGEGVGSGWVDYRADWALGPGDEKRMFEEFVRDMLARWEDDPAFHIYHYAPYEPTALKKLMGRHATCEEEIDRMLRAEVFVDLYSITRQALIAGVESYSIKRLEPLYGFERDEPLDRVSAELAAVERALEMGEVGSLPKDVLRTVERYNRDDCRSTLRLREWLEARREELIARGETIRRPEPADAEPSEDLSEKQKRFRELRDALLAKVPLASAEWSERHDAWSEVDKATWRLAHMLEFHWREDKATWWEYFRMAALGADELVDEKEGVGHLRFLGADENDDDATARCPVHRYSFPLQETSVERGDSVHWGKDKVGTVRFVDGQEIRIKKTQKHAGFHPPAVFAFDFIGSAEQEEALHRLGTWVLENGVDTPGDFRAARDLLLRLRPRLAEEVELGPGLGAEVEREATAGAPLTGRGEDLLDAARRLALTVDEGTLPVQGPPGAGKTYSGARMVCSLVAAGRTVGITANSHKVIRNLVDTVVAAAEQEGLELTVVQKVGKPAPRPEAGDGHEDEPPGPILEVTSNRAVRQALESGAAQVAAGTAWLWSREEFAGSVDTLVVDEAGQLSLASTLAVAQAGRALILLGDPKQLEQPLQGSHPQGTDVSARGLFHSRTWRLHPSICRFTSELFYDGRLESRQGLERQLLSGSERFSGAGLWLVPVEHDGNQSSSPEEVDAVEEIVDHLSSVARWTSTKGRTRGLHAGDILVVAPFNAQVSLLRERLGSRARVGTVDKFQGQEAPVVIYSMTTSTPEEAPRGMEFLYSLNRFNVATSRARCATILVASPRLLEPDCRTPRQMELANAYCRYREMVRETR